MSGAGSRSELEINEAVRALAPVRAIGGIRARFEDRGFGITEIAELSERGGYRLGLPRTFAAHAEAVQVNTGGGVIGGDQLEFSVAVGAGADACVTTQSAERIYRSLGPAAEVDVRLQVGSNGRLDWLPQQTILYSHARLKRRFEIDIAADSRLLLAEAITFGRRKSGELPGPGLLHDVWRVRRGDRLIYADAMRLDGHISELLSRPALAGGGCACGLLLYIASDAEDRLEPLRSALMDVTCDHGVSAWNGLISARFLGHDPARVREAIVCAIRLLSGRPLPRVWSI